MSSYLEFKVFAILNNSAASHSYLGVKNSRLFYIASLTGGSPDPDHFTQ
jgi:hypothetical protein